MPDAYLRLAAVTKRFAQTTAVDGVSLDIARGEFFALLGPSGCGKTTLLRLLAGFEQPDAGRILIDGADMAAVPPYERPVNMMFQSYALFPHMDVAQNVGFGLRQDRVPRRRIVKRVAEMLELVQLTGFARRKPQHLSGGERQRVALARALIKSPKLLLLDEPMAALDRKLREETRLELVRIQREVGITFLMVTHDQEEAMTMAARIAVMAGGRIVQQGPPDEVYEAPASRFVADFIGAINLLDGRVAASAAGMAVIESAAAGATLRVAHEASLVPGSAVSLAVRPEKIALSAAQPAPELNRLSGRVGKIAYRGDASTYHMILASGQTLRVTLPNRDRRRVALFVEGSAVWLAWEPAAGLVLTR